MHQSKASAIRVRRITDWEMRLRSAKAPTILGSVRQMSNLRSFTRVREPQQARPEIRVVTYNVLANKYAMGGNTYCPQEYLQWQYREPRIISELQHYSADLLCLQEVETSFYEKLLPQMQQQGYGGTYQSRVLPEVQSGPEEGIALLYRQEAFQELATGGFYFRDHAFGSRRLMTSLLMRYEGAVLLLLQHRASQQPLLVCCTHLFWNPNFPDVKAMQAAIMCQQITAFLQQQHQAGAIADTDVPVIIGGDFNSLWRKYRSDTWDEVPAGSHATSGVYRLLSTGQLEPFHADHPYRRQPCSTVSDTLAREEMRGMTLDTAGLKLSSMYCEAHGSEPPLTTKTATFGGCLDYIWISPHLQVSSTLDLPYPPGGPEPQQVDMPAIPNEVWPSDHLAMGCDLLLGGDRAAGAEGRAAAEAAGSES